MQRIGKDAHASVARPQTGEQTHALVAGNEIRRDEEKLRLDRRRGRLDALAQQLARLLARVDFLLLGTVVDRFGACPDQRPLAGENVRDRSAVAHGAGIYTAIHCRVMTVQRFAVGVEPFLGRLEYHEILNRNRQRTVPEGVEAAGQLPHHRPGDHQVIIAELPCLAGSEIGVTDVAAAGERNLVVDHEKLVVHPIGKPLLVQGELGHAHEFERPPVAERIEDAKLDAGMRGKRADFGIAADGFAVVDEDAHPYAAVRSVQQALDEQPARLVAFDGVVLNVERFFGERRHFDARAEASHTAGNEPESRHALMLAGTRLETLSELGLLGIRQCSRLGARDVCAERQRGVGRQDRASAERDRQCRVNA